jgi:hypothetical protein
MSGAFYLEIDGNRLASAEKPSAFRRLFTVQVGVKSYTLKAESAFGNAFVLTEHDREIGSIAPPRGFWHW